MVAEPTIQINYPMSTTDASAQPVVDIWIIEDDVKFRDTVTLLIKNTPNMVCHNAFGSCEDALEYLKAAKKNKEWTPPHVLLLDVNLPGKSGIESIGALKTHMPDTSIVMLTIRDDSDTIYKALRNGASGYLFKNAGVHEIISVIKESRSGGTLMPAPVARKVLGLFHEEPTKDYGLTAREREVLEEMSQGYTQKEIGVRLFITENTVNTHIQNIYAKLHVRSGIEAVARALRERLIR